MCLQIKLHTIIGCSLSVEHDWHGNGPFIYVSRLVQELADGNVSKHSIPSFGDQIGPNKMTNTTSTILVTGGAGFVGSHLCRELLLRGYKHVISLDDYSSGSEDNHVEGVAYIRCNTRDIGKIDLPAINTIFHLGEYSRVENSLNDIDHVLTSNITGTMAVLALAKSNRAKLIYAGSSTKFGDGGDTINETPYAFSKYVNTELVRITASGIR